MAVPTILVGTAVLATLVGTAVSTTLVGTAVPTIFVGTTVPTTIAGRQISVDARQYNSQFCAEYAFTLPTIFLEIKKIHTLYLNEIPMLHDQNCIVF